MRFDEDVDGWGTEFLNAKIKREMGDVNWTN